jgi:hypothetical protein
MTTLCHFAAASVLALTALLPAMPVAAASVDMGDITLTLDRQQGTACSNRAAALCAHALRSRLPVLVPEPPRGRVQCWQHGVQVFSVLLTRTDMLAGRAVVSGQSDVGAKTQVLDIGTALCLLTNAGTALPTVPARALRPIDPALLADGDEGEPR